MEKDIYNLSIHEVYEADGVKVTRVPGGWLYQIYNPYTALKENQYSEPVFVPLN